jgi:hypothetical protein
MKRSYRTEDMKCDECGKVEVVKHNDDYKLPGWISVNQTVGKFVNSVDSGQLDADFCSWECLEKFCNKQIKGKS